MDSAAFARARSFLNYTPLAKWFAILSGVAAALLYVALLVVLALFADLMEGAVLKNLGHASNLPLVVRDRSNLLGNLIAPLSARSDRGLFDASSAYLWGLFLTAVALAMLRVGFLVLAHSAAARASISAVSRLRLAVYLQAYRAGAPSFGAKEASESVSLSASHVEAIQTGLFAWLTAAFCEPVKFGLLLLFAMLVDFWLASAFLLFALLVWLVGGQIAAFFRMRGRAAERRSAGQLVLFHESLQRIGLVKVYLMEKFNLGRLESQLDKHAQAQLERSRGDAFYRPMIILVGMLAVLILLLVAGFVISSGYLGVTNALVMVAALVSLYWPAAAWIDYGGKLRASKNSARLLFDFLDRGGGVAQIKEAEFLPALSHKLEFDKVTVLERGTGRKLLDSISLTIAAGQRVALVGPDDAEKHALVSLLPRFVDATSGDIRLDRKTIRRVTLDSLRAQIGLVLQHHLIFSDTVANNIGCGDPSYNLTRIIEAAKVAHAHQFIQNLPKGYETPIGELGRACTSGEAFRIGLARAILRDPAIVIIEEPSEPLDDDTKSLIDDTYARVLPGRTVIFLPHRLSTIRDCDQVLLIHEGKLEAAGEHRELLSQSDLYRHLQYLEFNEFAGLGAGPTPPVEGTL